MCYQLVHLIAHVDKQLAAR